MRDDHARRRTSRPKPASPAAAADHSEVDPGHDRAPEPTSRAWASDAGTRWLLVATGACIIGCAGLIALGGSNLTIFLGISLGGIAFVLLLSTVFYAVGRSEDRERAERQPPPP